MSLLLPIIVSVYEIEPLLMSLLLPIIVSVYEIEPLLEGAF